LVDSEQFIFTTHEKHQQFQSVLISFISIITSNISVLVEHGLGEEGRGNFRLVHDTCAVILKIGNGKSSVEVAPYRLNEDHELFVRLEELLFEGVDEMKDDAYVPMSQQAVAVIFQVTMFTMLLQGMAENNIELCIVTIGIECSQALLFAQ
jgi:hypothetical protein